MNRSNNLKVLIFHVGIFLIGLLTILRGSITFIGLIGDLRGFSFEKRSYENVLGVFLLIYSLLAIIFSFVIHSLSQNQVKPKIQLFFQIISFLLLIFAGFSYFFFTQDVMTDISNSLIVENLHTANSTLLGAFGFIISLIFVGFSLSISDLRRVIYKDSNDLLTNLKDSFI
jgi:hypothetical protein